MVNNYSDLYQLPADDEELERLGACAARRSAWLTGARADMQHLVFTSAMGPLPPMAEILADDGAPKAALDLGCGSGSWCACKGADRGSASHVGPGCSTSRTRMLPFLKRGSREL